MRNPPRCSARTTDDNVIIWGLLERRDPIERLSFLRVRPVRFERCAMQDCPLANQPQRRRRLDVAHEHSTAEVKLALLALVLGVKVRRVMLLVKHPNDDSEEDRDDRYGRSIASSMSVVLCVWCSAV